MGFLERLNAAHEKSRRWGAADLPDAEDFFGYHKTPEEAAVAQAKTHYAGDYDDGEPFTVFVAELKNVDVSGLQIDASRQAEDMIQCAQELVCDIVGGNDLPLKPSKTQVNGLEALIANAWWDWVRSEGIVSNRKHAVDITEYHVDPETWTAVKAPASTPNTEGS